MLAWSKLEHLLNCVMLSPKSLSVMIEWIALLCYLLFVKEETCIALALHAFCLVTVLSCLSHNLKSFGNLPDSPTTL